MIHHDGYPVLMDPRHLARIDSGPAPEGPLVTLHDDGGDGFHEVTLDVAGVRVATRVVSDDASMRMMFRDFEAIIRTGITWTNC